MSCKTFTVIACYLFLSIIFPVHGESSSSDATILTVGSISNSPKEEIAEFQPFIDYLVLKLNNPKIIKGQVLIAHSLQDMTDLIKNSQVDLFIDSPFPIIAVSKNSGAVPFVRRWKKGVREYNSVIFARKDSGIKSILDLKGKMIAFEEQFSTSSYFLPKAAILKDNIMLVEKPRTTDFVPEKKIGYVFSYDDETTMIWVLRNKIAAGAINKADFIQLAKKKLSKLRILKESIYIPRQLVVHRKELPAPLIKNITSILIDMDKDEKGSSVLKAFEKTEKFELFKEHELSKIKELYDFVNSEFGL